MNKADKIIKYHANVSKAWEKAKTEGNEQEFLRYMIEHDVFFLLYYIIGRKDISHIDHIVEKPEDESYYRESGFIKLKSKSNGRDMYREYRPFLFDRCTEVQAHPDGYLDIWSRDHYKSTIITYAMTIQEILKNPEITICIYSYNASTATKMLGQIKNTLTSNDMLISLYPDILFSNTNVNTWTDEFGNPHKMEWSDEGFNVKRKGNPKEHTMECSGLVTGQKTGGHYNLLIYDDVVVPESVFTSGQIQKTTSQFRMSLNTASSSNYRIRMIGTRYAVDDTYSELIKDGTIKPRVYPCFDEDGKPVLYTQRILDEKKKGMHGSVWESQMLCDPKANSMWKFNMEWIPARYNAEELNKEEFNWYIICDPAGKQSARSDYTAMWVIGARYDGKYYAADLIRDKLTVKGKQEALFSLVAKWTNGRRRPMVFYEQVSMQSDIAFIEEKQRENGFNFTIIPVSGKPKLKYSATTVNAPKKDQRIQALQPVLQEHKVLFADKAVHRNWQGEDEDMLTSFFMDEYMKYPLGEHDDGMDSLSRIADLETGIMITFPDKPEDIEYHNSTPYGSVDSIGKYIPY